MDKAVFILRTQIYAVYADYFAHVGRVFSATNADLRRSGRADTEYYWVCLRRHARRPSQEYKPPLGHTGISA